MKIRSFCLKGFRGLWEFDASFGPSKAFLLFGRNGTGKTSLYRGLQFGITGDLEGYSSDSDTPPYQLSRHVLLDPADEAVVEIEFEDEGRIHSVRREIHDDGSSPLDCSTEDAENVISDPQRHLCFLNRERFSQMVESTERTRWQILSPLLGHEKLAEYREGIRKVDLNITSDLNINRYEDETSRLQSQVDRLTERLNNRCERLDIEDTVSPELLRNELTKLVDRPGEEAAPDKKEKYERLSTIDSLDDLEALDWDNVEKLLGGSEALTRMSEALTKANQRESLLDFSLFETPSEEKQDKETKEEEKGDVLSKLIDLLRRLDEDPNLGHQVLHAEFFENAREVVAPYTDEPCPVCGLKPKDWEEVRESLAEQEEQLESVANEKNQLQKKARQQLTGLKATANEIDGYRETFALTSEETDLRSTIQEGIDWLQLAVDRVTDKPAKGLSQEERQALQDSVQKIQENRNRAYKHLNKEKTKLEKRIEQREESPVRVRLSHIQGLADTYIDLEMVRAEYSTQKNWLEVAKPIRDRIQQYASEVNKAEGELSTQLLQSVAKRVKDIFQTITGNDQLSPKIDRSEDSSGIVRAKITITDFYGQGEKPAREYLSESYRNALGLSIYFAALEYRSPELKTLIMDDITHSTDDRHRTGLADFLWEDLASDWQLVLFSHEKEWFERLKSLFKGTAQTRRVLKWDPKAVQTKSDTWKPLREKAKEQVAAGEEGAGNVLRMALEEFLDDVCERLDVKVPFRRDPERVNFEVKRNRLIKTLNQAASSGQAIIDPNLAAVRRFEVSKSLSNAASHYPTNKKLSGPALKDALEDFEKFSDLFICTNQVGGSHCGWRLADLRNSSSLKYECPKCNQPYDV